ncbi:MAG: hypothetical protein ACYC3Q_03650 [Gemmatimonadaceae bacterium]
MPYRQFIDPEGSTWDVWEVRPAAAEEALKKVRAQRDPGDTSDWTAGAVVSEALASGWLCFESGSRKRRLAPIPNDWLDAPASALTHLWGMATPVTRTSGGPAPAAWPAPEQHRAS